MKYVLIAGRVTFLFALCALASCPKEGNELPISYDQKGSYFFNPLPVEIMSETFDGRATGPVTIHPTYGLPINDQAPSSIDNTNVYYRTTASRPAIGSAISVVEEKNGKSLMLEHQGAAGGNIATELLLYLNDDACADTAGKTALFQYRYRLVNTNNVNFIGPRIFLSGITQAQTEMMNIRVNGQGRIEFQNPPVPAGNGAWESTAAGRDEWNRVEIFINFFPDSLGLYRYHAYVEGKLAHESMFRYSMSETPQGTPALGDGINKLAMLLFSINTYNTTVYLDDIRISRTE